MHRRGIVTCVVLFSSAMPSAAANCPAPGLEPLRRFPAQSGSVRFVSDPVLAANYDGRLEVFAIGDDGALWHAWQPKVGNDKWSDWFTFGRPPEVMFKGASNDPVPGQTLITEEARIAVALDATGRLQAFVANGLVWQIGQVVPNANWGGWRALPTAPTSKFGSVWAIANADGRLEVFMADRMKQTEATLYHIWQTNPTTWSQVAEFGWPGEVPLRDFFEANQLALARDRRGRIVVATVTDSVVYVRRQEQLSRDWQPNWSSLGRIRGRGGADEALFDGTVSMAPNFNGKLELLVRGVSQPWHTWQIKDTDWVGVWAGFQSPSSEVSTAVLAQTRERCLVLLAEVKHEVGENVFEWRLHTRYQLKAGASWRGWGPAPDSAPANTRAVGRLTARVRMPDAELEVFVRGPNGSMLHTKER